jgi:aldehyde dehydrogenase (NAD+)
VQETTLYGATVKVNEAVGPIGIACPNEFPLLGFVSLFAPAIVRANTVIIIPSETHPLVAMDLCVNHSVKPPFVGSNIGFIQSNVFS